MQKNDVTFLVRDQQSRPTFFKLDSKVRLIDVGASTKEDYERKLGKILFNEKFDICISTSGLEFYFLHGIKDGSKKIFEFHFSFDISKVWMSSIRNPAKRWLLTQGQTLKRIYFARKYDHVVVLSKTDMKKWKWFIQSISYIYNPITIDNTATANYTNKQVVAVGRLEKQKGFDMLIDAWKKVSENHNDWFLKVYGDGILHDQLQKQIDSLNLSHSIFLEGRSNNIQNEYLQSSIYVMSSRAEGFPLVLLEASACGLPLVSFNCPAGPSEIIKNGYNGFLVPLGNTQMMAEKLNILIENEEMRKKMGQKSKKLSKRFEVDTIINQWEELFNKMTTKYDM